MTGEIGTRICKINWMFRLDDWHAWLLFSFRAKNVPWKFFYPVFLGSPWSLRQNLTLNRSRLLPFSLLSVFSKSRQHATLQLKSVVK
jgi:hypothetical protein